MMYANIKKMSKNHWEREFFGRETKSQVKPLGLKLMPLKRFTLRLQKNYTIVTHNMQQAEG